MRIESSDSQLNQPRAVLPRYYPDNGSGTFRESNERIKPLMDITFHDGPIEVRTEKGTSMGRGKISYSWQPRPFLKIYGEYDGDKFPGLEQTPEIWFRLPGQTEFNKVTVSASNTEPCPRFHAYFVGTSSGLTIGSPSALHTIIFHLPNFPYFAGSLAWFRNPEGTDESLNRATLLNEPWQITIDTAPGYSIWQQLAHDSNLVTAITHVGSIKNTDNGPFSLSEGLSLLDKLSLWFSFACGNWTAPVLATGLDACGQVVWWDWRTPNVQPARRSFIWPNTLNPAFLEHGFSAFCERYQMAGWEEAIKLAISCCVESTRQASGLETSIILSQTGLELLGWAFDGDGLSKRDRDEYKRLEAAVKIRCLLRKFDISTLIPAHFVSMQEFANANDISDGPECLTRVRNALVHNQPSHRNFLRSVSAELRGDIVKLSTWYTEMVLLRLCNFTGDYNNRLGPLDRYNRSIQPLPWS